MGINPIPEPSSFQKATTELNKIQEDLRMLSGGSISPDDKAALFKDAQTRLQALLQDKGIPQGAKEAINNVLKDMSSGVQKTPIGLLEEATFTIQQQIDQLKQPRQPGPYPEPFPKDLGPGGQQRIGPGGERRPLGPGGEEDQRLGPGGERRDIGGGGGVEKPRFGPGGTPPKQ